MGNRNNCLICGKELVYINESKPMKCLHCKREFLSNTSCEDGHYICDECHASPAGKIISRYCLESKSQNPFEIAVALMKHPSVNMHGPEHHFLVPAVLITAYYNSIGEPENIEGKLLEAEKRARSIPGGFCGFYGNCGAGVGTGMFISIITEASPLSKKEWKLCNLMTARSLMEIAENGGPRCCKRDTFIALSEAASFVRDNLGAELEENKNIKCEFNHMNRQCLGHECKYHHSNY